jgi:hypothetical protein
MNAKWQNRVTLAIAGGVVVFALLASFQSQPVHANRADPATSPPRYSVVETEAHNLIVTDNSTNTLYFYTVDKDKEVGSPLKLRGSIDLSQVGKPVISPTKAAE